MVGTPTTGDSRGNHLQGDASLTYRFPDGELDAAFTGIKDLNRLAAHTVESVRFENVPVYVGGAYRAGVTGNRIQGAFYGTAQAETAGVFEQSDIIGAFGARKQ